MSVLFRFAYNGDYQPPGGRMTISEQIKAGRPISAPAPWGDLARSVGGTLKLAESLGVAGSTVYKWSTGTHRIPRLARKELLRLCEEFGITEGVEIFKQASN